MPHPASGCPTRPFQSRALLLALAAAPLTGAAAPVSTAMASPPAPVPPPAASSPWPDEAGFQKRLAGMVDRFAAQDYLTRSMARATCPDTGLPVFSWAVEGETVHSPYTGRAFTQGDTGYFGPKRRDAQGRIDRFGGDPLKFALPAATAVLLATPRGPVDPAGALAPDPRRQSPREYQCDPRVAAAYLSIPGNLAQHYHFAAVNWARLLPLVGDRFPPAWHEAFQAAVAVYEENRRPSDGPREYLPLPQTENLVGRDGEHLGGGGTENHKTMWRSAGLLYAQILPGDSPISRFPRAEAIARTFGHLDRYVRLLYRLGAGEYDSSTYYPYSLRAFLNLHDFSPDARTRDLARAALDWYLATYALKVFNGVHTGAQRRGWSDGTELGEMERHLWAWAARDAVRTGDHWLAPYSTARVPASYLTTLHQATSSYRPHPLILRLLRKEVPLPFSARLQRPDYGMNRLGAHVETFWCAPTHALGSVQLDVVNNSAQQTVWSLNLRGPRGSLLFGGGQPRWQHPEGHSPYDQHLQHEGALVLLTAATAPTPGQPEPLPYRPGSLQGPLAYTRQAAYSGPLDPTPPPPDPADAAAVRAFVSVGPRQAATWFYAARDARVVARRPAGDGWVLEGPEAWVVVRTTGGAPFWLEPDAMPWIATSGPNVNHPADRLLRDYRVLVIPGLPSGFAVEAVARRPDLTPADLLADDRFAVEGLRATYRSHAGHTLELTHDPTALRPRARVNGRPETWEPDPDGPAIESPVLRLHAGTLQITADRETWSVTYGEDGPRWSPTPVAP